MKPTDSDFLSPAPCEDQQNVPKSPRHNVTWKPLHGVWPGEQGWGSLEATDADWQAIIVVCEASPDCLLQVFDEYGVSIHEEPFSRVGDAKNATHGVVARHLGENVPDIGVLDAKSLAKELNEAFRTEWRDLDAYEDAGSVSFPLLNVNIILGGLYAHAYYSDDEGQSFGDTFFGTAEDLTGLVALLGTVSEKARDTILRGAESYWHGDMLSVYPLEENPPVYPTYTDDEGDTIYVLPVRFTGNIDADLESLWYGHDWDGTRHVPPHDMQEFLYGELGSDEGISDSSREHVYWGSDVQDFIRAQNPPEGDGWIPASAPTAPASICALTATSPPATPITTSENLTQRLLTASTILLDLHGWEACEEWGDEDKAMFQGCIDVVTDAAERTGGE